MATEKLNEVLATRAKRTTGLPQVDPGILAAEKKIGAAVSDFAGQVKSYPSRVQSALEQRAQRAGMLRGGGAPTSQTPSWGRAVQNQMDAVAAGNNSTKPAGAKDGVVGNQPPAPVSSPSPETNFIQVGSGPRVSIDDPNAVEKLRGTRTDQDGQGSKRGQISV